MVRLFDESGRHVSDTSKDIDFTRDKNKPNKKYIKPKLTKLQLKNKKIIQANKRNQGKFKPDKGRYQSSMLGLNKHASVFCQLKGKRSQRKAF